MRKERTIFIAIILILMISTAFFAFGYLKSRKQLHQVQQNLKAQKINKKVLDFTKFFIEKVLKAKGEVDFETRLKLENAVRSLNDEQILNQWQKFTNSKTEEEAQENVKNLLEILINKID